MRPTDEDRIEVLGILRWVYGLDLIASIEGSTATYHLTDGLGSTTQLADGAGAVTGAYTYDKSTARPGPGENGTRIGELP